MRVKNGRGLSAVRCRGCAQAWLMPGARAGEAYICKACGHPLTATGPPDDEGGAVVGPRREGKADGESQGTDRRAGGSR
ncbi:MAG TPA: hypothetical protein VK421_12120 [Pyrinomonadaceae bacterium]|nr:hypothetical protein [Pyrinomonadaceae bacterium]